MTEDTKKKVRSKMAGMIKFTSLREALDDVSKTLEKQHTAASEKLRKTSGK